MDMFLKISTKASLKTAFSLLNDIKNFKLPPEAEYALVLKNL